MQSQWDAVANMQSSDTQLYEDWCCKLNFYFFCIFNHMPQVGLVPRVLYWTITAVILSGAVVCQLALFFSRDADLQTVISVIPQLSAIFVAISFLTIFHTNRDIHGILVFKLKNMYERPERHDVFLIKQRMAMTIRKYLWITTVGGPLSITGMFSTIWIPRILDVIAPLNESRPYKTVLIAEHFIDVQEYYYIIYCIHIVVAAVVLSSVGIVLNCSILFLLAIVTLFKIIGYRMRTAGLTEDGSPRPENDFLKELSLCIDEHTDVLRFVKSFTRISDPFFLCGLISTMGTFTFTLVQIMDPELADMKTAIFMCCQLVNFSIGSLLGQKVIDASVKLSEEAYESAWYKHPIHSQKLILFIIMRSQRPCYCTIKGMFTICNKNLAAVLQTMISYCMVLRQMQ